MLKNGSKIIFRMKISKNFGSNFPFYVANLQKYKKLIKQFKLK